MEMRKPWALCRGVFVLLFLAFHGYAEETPNWCQFRGPDGDGIARFSADESRPTRWSEDAGVIWKVDVEGVAWSQPIVWRDQVFVTTAVTDDQPTPQRGESGPGFRLLSRDGLFRTFAGGSPPKSVYQWKLICFDLATGDRQWEKIVHEGRPTVATHRSNSFASETPATDGQHIFVTVAMVGIYCFDMTGQEVWRQPLKARRMQLGWGTGSSPCLVDDTLYLLCDNEQASYLAALDKSTGQTRWRVERDEKSNWSTPYLWRNRIRSELVTCGGAKTRSYDPTTGDLLWQLNASGRCATTAVGDKERLYVGSVTRSTGRSGTLTAVRAGAEGELDLEQAGEDDAFVAWTIDGAAPQLASPLLYEDRLYTLRQQGGITVCYDAVSGRVLFRERLPRAGGFTASPWGVDGHVYCLDENGKTFVLAAAPKLQLVSTNELNGMFWSSAAVTKDSFLLRSVDHLYRLAVP